MKKTSLAAAALDVGLLIVALTATAGTQQCNTACQSRMTDCVLGCDGRLPCEIDCKHKAVECVEWCSSDAAVAPMAVASRPGDGGIGVATDARPADANRARSDAEAGKIQASRDR